MNNMTKCMSSEISSYYKKFEEKNIRRKSFKIFINRPNLSLTEVIELQWKNDDYFDVRKI